MENKTVIETPAQALVKAKAGFNVVVKDSVNPFHKNRYASLTAINNAVDSSLLSNGLMFTTSLQVIDNKTYLVSRLLHVSGIFDPCWQQSLYEMPDTADAQKKGIAMTYGRRYNKCALLDLTAEAEDDGNGATTVSNQQLSVLKGLVAKHDWSTEDVTQEIKKLGYKKASELDLTAFSTLCDLLASRASE